MKKGIIFSAICEIDGKILILSSPLFENPFSPKVTDADRFFAGRLFYAVETVEDFHNLVNDICQARGVEAGLTEDAPSPCTSRDLLEFSPLPFYNNSLEIPPGAIHRKAWQSASIVYVVNLTKRDFVFVDGDDSNSLYSGFDPNVLVYGVPRHASEEYVDMNPAFFDGLCWATTKKLMRDFKKLSTALHKVAGDSPTETDARKELLQMVAKIEKDLDFWKKRRNLRIQRYIGEWSGKRAPAIHDSENGALADNVFGHGLSPAPFTFFVVNPVKEYVRLADTDPGALLSILTEREGKVWAEFVARRPKFFEAAPLDCLSGRERAMLLAVRPELADRVDMRCLSASDWVFLLRRRPELARLCDWYALSGADWVALLCGTRHRNVTPGEDAPQPCFAEHCQWERLSGSDWAVMLAEHPDWAACCNTARDCDGRSGWERLAGADWARLLARQPQFAAICDWDRFSGADWVALLRTRPEFADHCDWGRLGGHDWTALLLDRPEFASQCAWGKIGGADAVRLVFAHPGLADHIAWRNLSGRDWHVLLGSHPEFTSRKPADVAIDHTSQRPLAWLRE